MEFVILEEDNPGNNSCNELTSSDIEYIDEYWRHCGFADKRKNNSPTTNKKKFEE